MSLSTPQTVTVDTVATDLHRVQVEKTSSTYASNDGNLKLKVSHQETAKRTRHLARYDKTVTATDPLTAEKAFQSAGCYLVIDEPLYGFTDADLEAMVTEFLAWLPSQVSAIIANRH